MKQSIYLLGLGCAAIFMHSTVADACRGPFPQSIREAYDKAAVVFAGRVAEMTEKGAHPQLPQSKIYEAKFQVSRWWKGGGGREIQILLDDTSCGVYRFMKNGDEWVIFGAGSPRHTSLLSGNIRITEPGKDW